MGNESFSRTGDGWVTFTIPAGVESLTHVEIRGGGSPNNPAGLVTGSIDVKKINAITFYLGEAGHPNSAGTGGPGGAAGHRGGLDRVGAGGRGGDSTTGPGGDGGGSATAIWVRQQNGDLGRLLAVAGGAGGDSGNGGGGGPGGAQIGGDGHPGDTNGGLGGFTAATGGRQNEGGFGGISPVPGHNGEDAERVKFGKAGRGHNDTHGGGGGGSGFFSGGGGQGGVPNRAPDGGGAGGSNFIGGMHKGARSIQGNGGAGNGSVQFYWQKKKANHPPTIPSDVKVNGRNENPGMSAGGNTARIEAKIFDTDHDKVRLLAQISSHKNFVNAHPTPPKHSAWVQVKKDSNPVKATVVFEGLQPNKHYWVRLWSEDEHGLKSLNYKGIDFWTNRGPKAPTLTGPPNYMLFPDTATVDFTWEHNDPDGAAQSAFRLRYRVAGTPTQDPLPWHHAGGKDQMVESSTESWSLDGDMFLGNYRYEWQVRTRDNKNRWSPWSNSRQFSTRATLTPPQLDEPQNLSSVEEGADVTFTWHHVNWQDGLPQYTADFRYRLWDPAVSDDDAAWFTIPGTSTTPGADTELVVPAEFDFGAGLVVAFIAGHDYAWQVRTYSGMDFTTPSGWSEASRFTAIQGSGSAIEDIDPDMEVAAGPLGCGDNRVMVVTRPVRDPETGLFHQTTLGEILPMTSVQWSRLRDDISSCQVTTTGYGDDCGELLKILRSWQHELVVYRDGVRVWEGPITRVAYYTDRVEIEAKDPMVYVYRRVMRVGYNDTYRKIHGVIVNRGGRSVVDRATRIIQNALCYDDPNVLAYLTRMDADDDAKEARSLAAYQKTAWEEVDDLAATAGLDYTTVGRRIILNDVHNPIGKLPVMRSGDFSEDPVVTEYGMSLANVFFVSSMRGQWGSATPEGDTDPPSYYPFVEQLTSAYGEDAEDAKKTVTADKKVALSEKLTEQAVRHLTNRWPAPLLVRVPDNSVLSPDLGVGINQLIPGVWIPVQATNTLREVTQWQKLDSVTVKQSGDAPEQIAVVLSPAPLGKADEEDLAVVTATAMKTNDGTAT